MTSKQRIQTVIRGGTPDRPPLFDLLRNNAVLEHYSGARLDAGDPRSVVYAAVRKALDGTRSVRLPDKPGEEVLPDGRRVVRRQWTSWTKRAHEPTVDEVIQEIRGIIASLEARLEDGNALREDAARLRADLQEHLRHLGPDFGFFGPGSSVGFMIYTRWGLESFCYALADEPGLFSRYWELQTELCVRRIACLDISDLVCGVFCGEDIAYKSGTLFSVHLLRREYFPRLRRIVEAYHRQALPVMFHSDGNLMPVLDDLVGCGIDLLNPIEVLAGMKPAEIRRRHPRLVLAGGMDVSQLLPFGSAGEVAAATRRLIEDAGPGVLVGSSTELHNLVPLANFQAMAESARNWCY
ncbi:MAG: hypothetical protein HYU36_00230 [Planctomycetes bacterium]|nr:hypothetical protein [Planctomycetota bacterium]